MAKSKSFLFTDDEQLGSSLCLAMAHPARMRMMGRLLRHRVVPYSDLIEGIPLAESSIARHISLMEREGFLEPCLLANNLAGYQISRAFYKDCTAASRRVLLEETVVAFMRISGHEEVG